MPDLCPLLPTTRRPLLLFLLVLLVSLPSSLLAAPLKLLVSVAPQQYLLQQLVDETAQIRVLIGPGQSPATFDPTPQQMAQIVDSDLLFSIGVPFERIWLPRLRQNAPGLQLIDCLQGLPLRQLAAHHHPGEEDTATHHHQADERDPHVWLDPLLCSQIAVTLCQALQQHDPAQAPLYAERLSRLQQQLLALHEEISAELAGLSSRRFMVFHPAWGYFAARYGLEQVAIEQAGKEPGGAHLARLIQQARAENIGVIFVQQQFSQRAATTLARQIGARVVPLDPLSADLPAMLRATATALKQALEP
ncbi:metal ABC transporter solute-binding protein, Zn/Mn family [Desulfuromonas thiophila]|uniref:Zinc transport system substrate-binding protein n=1 Tax=Desulfuromonas thiophila TaxID=57664 RepID=A0A1G6XWT2_9BACT|nr:zinc ABC transporter substrate-binding protein [Desulfuromonas thiophila]SDD82570.1 zinc transport system substrate-binding protein [Desulfuromonas thiophila]